MKPLRTYIILKNFSLELVQPFISFVSAAYGLIGEQLGLISSAGTVLPSVVQFFLGYVKARAKTLVSFGTFLTGILWLVLSIVPFSIFFTIVYLALDASMGISIFGWYLIMEKVSLTSRGKILAQYSFYSTFGGLIATLITGFIVGERFSLIRYFFIIAGVLTLLDGVISTKFDVDYEVKNTIKINISRELKDYLLISFLFNIVWSLAWPLFPMAQVYVFKMNFSEVAIISVISGSSTLLLQRKIGKLVDKNRKIMMFTGRLALATFPLAYALSTSVYEIYLANVVAGFTNSVNSTAYMSYLYDSSSDVKRSVGIYSAIGGLGDLIGSSIGSILAEYFTSIAGIDSIRLLMLGVGVLRILASIFYLKLPEPKPFKPKIVLK
ncbi:MFS transporter [Acidianus brierleyi]|uniref:MFS transporter n=1 Tax=Acidianus brierleyi TaxID=41673 RepID=A0A2U9IGR2_9CREN|nr:MFS transporter [Acidianus brierleyi]AWR95223.1 MFS transporter [Acidianus brierleyi]